MSNLLLKDEYCLDCGRGLKGRGRGGGGGEGGGEGEGEREGRGAERKERDYGRLPFSHRSKEYETV